MWNIMSYHKCLTCFIIFLIIFVQNIVKCKDGLKFWEREPKYWTPSSNAETVITKKHTKLAKHNDVDENFNDRRSLNERPHLPLVYNKQIRNTHGGPNMWFTTAPKSGLGKQEKNENEYPSKMAVKIGDFGYGVEYTTQNEGDYLNIQPLGVTNINIGGRSELKTKKHKKKKNTKSNETKVTIIDKEIFMPATDILIHGRKDTRDKHKTKKHHKKNKKHQKLEDSYEKKSERDVMILSLIDKKEHDGKSKKKHNLNKVENYNEKERKPTKMISERLYADSEDAESTTHQIELHNHRFKVLKSQKRQKKEKHDDGHHKKATRSSDTRMQTSNSFNGDFEGGSDDDIKKHDTRTQTSNPFNGDSGGGSDGDINIKKHLRDNSEEKGKPKKSKIHKLSFVPKSEHGKPLNLDMQSFFSPYSIARQLNCLQKQSDIGNAAVIEQEIIGHTAEFNDIVLWKMKENVEFADNEKETFRANDNHKYEDVDEKKIILIVHGLNTMGWQHLPCISKILEFKKLLSYYLENLDSFDIFLIPMANPDGVKKLKQNRNFNNFERHDFQWNKNMSPQSDCPGVALDRNFDVAWNLSLTNLSSCSPLYPGPDPFSEHETVAIKEIFHKYGNKIVGYFHVHGGTYDAQYFKGDAVLYPKGYSDLQQDDDRYVDLRGEIDEALRNASFRVATVTVDTLISWYGRVGGTSVDYAASIYGIPYAMEFVMQVYKDDYKEESQRTMDDVALTELWQVVLDVTFDHIYRTEVKPNEKTSKK